MQRISKLKEKEYCKSCGKRLKKVSYFIRNQDNPDYFDSYCRKCFNKMMNDDNVRIIGLYFGCGFCKAPISESSNVTFIKFDNGMYKPCCNACKIEKFVEI